VKWHFRTAKSFGWLQNNCLRSSLNSPCLIAAEQHVYCSGGKINVWSHLGEERPEQPHNFHMNPSRGRIESIKSASKRSQKVTLITCPKNFLGKLNLCRIHIPENAIVQVNPLKTSLQLSLLLSVCYFCPLLQYSSFSNHKVFARFRGKPRDLNNFPTSDLIDEMELWARNWNVANKGFWSRLAKSLQSKSVSHIGRKNRPKTPSRFSARPWKKIGSLHLRPSFVAARSACLTLHLNYHAGYIDPLIFFFEHTQQLVTVGSIREKGRRITSAILSRGFAHIDWFTSEDTSVS